MIFSRDKRFALRFRVLKTYKFNALRRSKPSALPQVWDASMLKSFKQQRAIGLNSASVLVQRHHFQTKALQVTNSGFKKFYFHLCRPLIARLAFEESAIKTASNGEYRYPSIERRRKNRSTQRNRCAKYF